jgi:hypothetical protein
MGIQSGVGGHWDGDVYRCTDDSTINHGVVIAGYSDDGGYWIVKNSWGSSWNGNGYFKVGYGECGIENYAYYADAPTLMPTPTRTGTPTPTATATPTPDPALDSDGDGCTDVEELGPNPALGGGRSPLNPFDFYDVPVPAIDIAGPSAIGDKGVTGSDLGALLYYTGTSDNGPPNVYGADYDDDLNGNGIEDGREYDRSAGPGITWSGPPDGGVAGADLGALQAQTGHSCQAPP